MSVMGTIAAWLIIPAFFFVVIYGVIESPEAAGALLTAAGAVGAVAYQRDRENKRLVQERHRERLAPLYEGLFEVMRRGLDVTKKEDEQFILDLQRNLVLYGSTPVVLKWLDWMRAMPDVPDEENGTPELLLQFEQVLLAIRKDLGHNNDGLMPGDLIRVYVPDADEHFAAWRAVKEQLALSDGHQ